ncbi:MAG: AsmA-like C-terminal domain-containing protein [Syntrophobacteraceae bacterium]
MQRSSKLFPRIAIGTGFALLFALALVLLPNAVHLDTIRQEILSGIREKTGCEVEYREIELSFFPRPSVMIRQGSFSHPRGLNGSFESLRISPRIPPLLLGEFKLASLDTVSPRVSLDTTMIPVGKSSLDIPFSRIRENHSEVVSAGKEVLAASLAYLASEFPGLTLKIEQGEFTLSMPSQQSIRFLDIHGTASLPSSRMEARLACRSDLFSGFSFEGVLHPENLSGNGRFSLNDLQIGKIPFKAPFLPDSDCSVEGSLSWDASGDIQARLNASVPLLAFTREQERHEIRGGILEGDLNVKEGSLQLTLGKLLLESPRIHARGKYESTPGGAAMTIEAENADATSIRALTLALARDVEVVRNVFNVIREGQVPKIRFTSSAPRPSELGTPGNSLIEGNIARGRVFIKKIALDIEDVIGDVVIRNGILEGTNLEGRTGSSTTRGGYLLVGLKDADDTPFHLDLYITADLADLPPVLHRVVKNRTFLEELSLVNDLHGKGKGRLLLGETLGDVYTQVFIDEFEMEGVYGRLPHPVRVAGGAFTLDGEKISLAGVDFFTGKSNLSVGSLSFDWENAPRLDVHATESKLYLPEDIPLKTDINGVLTLESLEMTGSAAQPEYLKIAGTVENARVASPFGPVALANGKYTMEEDRTTLTDMNLAVQDASLLVSGSYTSDKGQIKSLDLTLQGKVGPEMNRRVFDLISIPMRLKPPLNLSPGARLAWNLNGQVSFSGSPLPGVSLDVEKNAQGDINARQILIRDEFSNVSMALGLKKRELDLDINGGLSGKSLTRLLEKNDLLKGAIKGKLKTRLNLDHPMAASAKGSLELFGFGPNLPGTGPVWIERASIEAGGNLIDIRSSEVYFRETQMGITGLVTFSPDGYVLNLDVVADSLNWEKFRETKKPDEANKEKDGPQQVKDPEKTPLEGVVRVAVKSFTYGDYTWEPLEARLTLKQDRMNVELTRAALCGISTPGTLELDPLRLKLRLEARDQDLEHMLECFWKKKGLMTGSYNLKGNLSTPELKESVAKSLTGDLDFLAKDGRIYRFAILTKIFSVLNVTEIYKGQLPDLTKEGCPYDEIKMKGNLKDGVFTLGDSSIDGPCVRMVWKGTVDIVEKKVDLVALVSPLKTVDSIVKHIPVIGNVLGGSLLTIPVQVVGDLQDPYVIPMSPAAVGSEFLGYMKRVFQLPITLLQPLLKKE